MTEEQRTAAVDALESVFRAHAMATDFDRETYIERPEYVAELSVSALLALGWRPVPAFMRQAMDEQS